MTAAALRVDVVDALEDLEALRDEWRLLQARCTEKLPFHTWEWSVSWWRALRRRSALTQDRMYTLTVRAEDGRLVGVAPMWITERPGRGPARARYLHFLGSDPNITEVCGPVVDPDYALPATEALYARIRGDDGQWDWLRWTGVREGSDVETAVRSLGPIEWEEAPNPAFVLPLPASWDALRGSLKRNIKESLRKCYNSLKRDGLQPSLKVLTAPEDVRAGVEQFLALHELRARIADGVTVHRNVFERPESRAFLRDVCQRFAERGNARVYQLLIGEALVAVRLGFVLGDTVYLYYSGWDPAWAKYGVMTTTLAEALKHAISEKLLFANLSTGRDVSKTRWSPQEVKYLAGLELSRSVRSRLGFSAFRAYQRMKQKVKPPPVATAAAVEDA